MIIYNRSYDELLNDFKKMWNFLIEDYTERKEQFIWHIGRLGDWKYGLWSERKLFPNFMRKNAQLWMNNLQELVGFVISENCDAGFFILAKRGYEFLYADMLEWVLENWGGREGQLTTEVHEFQTDLITLLEEKGFKGQGPVATTRQYDLLTGELQQPVLPAGMTILDMVTNPDFRGKKILHNNGFSDKNTLDNFDLLQFEYNRESPCYNPNFDLSVVDAAGNHLATCTAFIDYVNKVAEVEKICTHSDYRQRGLALAVVRECFIRLQNDGIESAYITGYSEGANNLYEKLGAVKWKKWYHYTLA